jgi:Xaa-Pro aminopeptidase
MQYNVQQLLKERKLDGWLLYDFRRSNDIACSFLEIPPNQLLTRRFYYWIPTEGDPIKIVSAVEPHTLDHLKGNKVIYHSWQDLENLLKKTLRKHFKIAMEYSPYNAVPTVSKLDAGTMDFIRSLQVEVVSSADLLQKFTSVWTEEQLASHRAAANFLDHTAGKTWRYIAENLHSNITEYDVQQFILLEMEKNGFITDHDPICAVNENSADPHYTPNSKHSKKISSGDFILIDLWCKQKLSKAVYADISRVGIVNRKPTSKEQEIFAIVLFAQKAATDFVRQSFETGKPICGWEVDQVARNAISEKGYGKFFVHRTGHNIGIQDHGTGTHMDNLETHDDRLLIPGTCFSIEPGIYIPAEFGIRLEYDVYIHINGKIEITGGIQETIVTI